MKVKKTLSLILTFMLLITSNIIPVSAEDSTYTAPDLIYYNDFSENTDGMSEASNVSPELKTDDAGNGCMSVVPTDNALLRFTTSGITGAEYYVVEYRLKPVTYADNGNRALYCMDRGGTDGFPCAGIYVGKFTTTGLTTMENTFVENGEWYTITNVFKSEYVSADGSEYVSGDKYLMRDTYVNGELLDSRAVSASGGLAIVDGNSTTMELVFRTSGSFDFDLDYIKFYTMGSNFGATVAAATNAPTDEAEVWFNGIPEAADLLTKAEVVDTEGNKVAGIESATINNKFNPGTDFAQSYTLKFDTKLKNSTPYKVKIDGLSDCWGNTFTGELPFVTKAMKIYGYDFRLIKANGSEQTTLADGTYDVSLSFINENDIEEKPVVAVALYDAKGVLSSLTLKELTAEESTETAETLTVSDVVLSGTEGGTLKIFALKSKTEWTPVSATVTIDESGKTTDIEYNPELTNMEKTFSIKSTVDGDSLRITTAPDGFDEEMSGRHMLLLMLKEGKTVDNISLDAPLETVIAIDSAYLTEAGVTYSIPDERGNYPVYMFVSNLENKAEGTLEYFGNEYIEDGRLLVKDIVASEVDGFLKDYENALFIDLTEYNSLSDEQKVVYANSIEALRCEKESKEFADFEAFFAAMPEAQVFAEISGNEDIQAIADERLKDEAVYALWKEDISQRAKSAVLSELYKKGVLTYKQLADEFEVLTALCGIKYSENYSQTLKILTDMADVMGIGDITKYSAAVQKTVASNMTKGDYKDFEELEDDFDDFVSDAVKQDNKKESSSGGGSSRPGGSGGMGSVSMGAIPPAKEQAQTSEAKKFADLSGYEWAEDAVYALTQRGIINGKTENSFAPADFITRAELTKLVVAMYGIATDNGESVFEDVDKNDWFAAYVNAAVKRGIINGTGNGEFAPYMNVTREMAAVIVYRAAVKNGMIFENNISRFNDMAQIEEYAKDAIGFLAGAGILNGDEAGNVNPQKPLTRAEAAVLLNNLLKD